MVSVSRATLLYFFICVSWVQSKSIQDEMKADLGHYNDHGIHKAEAIAKKGCLKEDNIDYYGSDIGHEYVSGADACANLCGKTTDCKFWTLAKYSKTCWLKTSDADKRTNINAISGTNKCAIDCQDGNGDDYSGSTNRTESGLTCQRWDSQYPHEHYFGHLGDHNGCRNPTGDPSVWCYTTDPDTRWEYCDLPVCVGSDSCATTNPQYNDDCVFPFYYESMYDYDYDTGEAITYTFNGCTNFEDIDKKLYCITGQGYLDYCSKNCPVDVHMECHTNLFSPHMLGQDHACDADQEKYCKISKKNTMCQYCGLNTTACGKAVCSFGITDQQEINEIVDRHNQLRRKLAKGEETGGKFGGQPQAANMNELVWDPEVARMAQAWANQCDDVNPHDKNRNMDKGWEGYCGQNAYWMGHHPYYGHPREKFLTKAVDAWYDEVNVFDDADVSKYGSGDHDGVVGHYTQLVWADATKIGCGYVQRWDGEYFSETIKCNYCPGGNWKDMPIYKIGEPGSECPEDRKNDDGLCVPK